MWKINDKGEKVFSLGKEAWQEAVAAAGVCTYFSLEDRKSVV